MWKISNRNSIFAGERFSNLITRLCFVILGRHIFNYYILLGRTNGQSFYASTRMLKPHSSQPSSFDNNNYEEVQLSSWMKLELQWTSIKPYNKIIQGEIIDHALRTFSAITWCLSSTIKAKANQPVLGRKAYFWRRWLHWRTYRSIICYCLAIFCIQIAPR